VTATRSDATVATLVALGAFAVYAAGACRTIYVGDSGELVTAVYLLGIPHPTGYPLYVLLGKLWTLLVPAGSIAFRMSLFSAAVAALAGAGLFLVARRAGCDRPAALTGAGLLLFAPSFWGEANVQRVYALGALFVVAATAAALEWQRTRSTRWLAATAFLCGLGAANHTYMAVFGLAFGLHALAVEPAIRRAPRRLAAALGAFVAGLSPYLYLPLRARAAPALDWGDPRTLDRFLAVVTRRDFWDRRFLATPRDLLVIAGDYLASFPVELTAGGAALALLGLALGGRRGSIAWLAGLAMLGNLAAMALHGSRSDLFVWHRYYVPSYALAALAAALGADAIARRLPRRLPWLLLALPALQLVAGYGSFDRSRYRIAEDYGRRLLAALPPGAHLSATDDNILFVQLYLHFVSGVRPDVDLLQQGVGGASLAALHFDPEHDRLFFTHHPNWNLAALDVVPQGLAFEVVRHGMARPVVALEPPRLDGELDLRVPKDHLTSNLIGEFHYMRGLNFEASDFLRAEAEFERALVAAPQDEVLAYNLGLIYARNGLYGEAVAAFEGSRRINPRHLPGSETALAADRVAALKRETGRLAAIRRRIAPELESRLAALAPGERRRLAALLEAAGEGLAARGERLRAAIDEAGLAPPGADRPGP
jgi:tetratricopeptide (TPR) repeat protein